MAAQEGPGISGNYGNYAAIQSMPSSKGLYRACCEFEETMQFGEFIIENDSGKWVCIEYPSIYILYVFVLPTEGGMALYRIEPRARYDITLCILGKMCVFGIDDTNEPILLSHAHAYDVTTGWQN